MSSQSSLAFILTVLLVLPLILNSTVLAESTIWDHEEQPWAQYGHTPYHDSVLPTHGDSGLLTITEPIVNWQAFDDESGADGYGSIIVNLSASVTRPDGAAQRCGEESLFAVMSRSSDTSESADRYLSIIAGDSAKTAWEVNLGSAERIRATPVAIDIDADGKLEIIVVYDTSSALNVDVWSPDLSCDESGWSSSGHDNEKMWTWTSADHRIGITSPHLPTAQSGHKAVTQPLLADLAMDGSPELVIAAVDVDTEDVTVLAIPLTLQGPPESSWEITLDRGTHPSDPAFAALDDSTGCIVLTTINANSGNMWIWRIDGATGSLDWERVSISGTDSDNDAPRLKLPGPVVTQLDSDSAPEMILTLPSDANGRDNGMGAQYVAMELTSTDEIWRFRAPNGYADAMPTPVDTDNDSISDRLCWVTWYSTSSVSFNRQGLTGCHDISVEPPFKEWAKQMERGSGTDNDEIAASPPIVIDINGDDIPELLVAFGCRIYAFDGITGAPADINNAWSSPLSMPHRVWAAPAVADLDGDGFLDILVGDTLISQALPDLAPLADDRGIGFNPVDPDPGETLTVSGQFSNIGTVETDEPVDAVLLMNGDEIARFRSDAALPVAPSGEGGPITFSIEITATLGEHIFELILDPNENITQARDDNDNASATLSIVDPYVAQISIPSETTRVVPGNTDIVTIILTSVGSRTADWSLTYDDSSLADGWSFDLTNGESINHSLVKDTPVSIDFEIHVPSTALGDESALIPLTLKLNSDSSVTSSVILPIDVFRTRGLSVEGPSGLSISEGHGRIGENARAWVRVQNMGNAPETTSFIGWSSSNWDDSPNLVNTNGDEVFGIELNPMEAIELIIEIEVESGSTQFELTMCIGYGDDEICEIQKVIMHSNSVAAPDAHIRTIPATGLSWLISGDLGGFGVVSWDISNSDMREEDWIWSAEGSLSLDGDFLNLSGSGYEFGWLNLSLPNDASPHRHFFNTSATGLSNYDLNLSLHVLQVYRSAAMVASPNSPATFNVSESTKLIVKLENPGNGEDTFTLSGHTTAGNLSLSPDVEFMIPAPTETLGAGEVTLMPIWVTLSEDIPAREQFELVLTWTSLSDSSVDSEARITVQARPDHRWNVSVEEGLSHSVIPGQILKLNLSLTNVGNAVDSLLINPQINIDAEGGDTSQWQLAGASTAILGVNGQETMALDIIVPDNTWAGTKINITLISSSDDIILDNPLIIVLEVAKVSGWWVNLSGSNLEVPPQGGNVTLTITQQGNTPSAPWFSKAGDGWNISLPVNAESISPGESTQIVVFATPPEDSIAGQIGVIRLRISDGDGSGLVIEEVPMRVGSAPGIVLDSNGDWLLSTQGGLPTAWIENTGNDVAVVAIDLLSIPTGWTLTGDSSLVLAPATIQGIPLDLRPSADWDGSPITLTITANHPLLGVIELPIQISSSPVSYSSTPVLYGPTGQVQDVSFYNDSELPSASATGLSLVFSGEIAQITLESGRINGSIDFSSTILEVHTVGKNPPAHTAECSKQKMNLTSLGINPFSGVWTSCILTASDDSPMVATLILRSSTGEVLDSRMLDLYKGTNSTVNLTISQWDPEPGMVTIIYEVIDSSGLILESGSSSMISRQSGWNIGIANMEIDGDSITVGIKRQGHSMLVSANCILALNEIESGWNTRIFVDIASSTYAPILSIDRPEIIEAGSIITANISCEAPWDTDDDASDDSSSAIAEVVPLVEFGSGDVVWTISVATTLIGIAWLGGIIGSRKSVTTKKSTSTKSEKKTVEIPVRDEPTDDISLDELDELDDLLDEIQEQELPEEIVEILSEDAVVNNPISEDPSASGKLGALRREIAIDDDDDTEVIEQEDIRSRMDRFFSER